VGETVCSMQRSPLEAAVRRPVGQKLAAKVDSVSAFRLPAFCRAEEPTGAGPEVRRWSPATKGRSRTGR